MNARARMQNWLPRALTSLPPKDKAYVASHAGTILAALLALLKAFGVL